MEAGTEEQRNFYEMIGAFFTAKEAAAGNRKAYAGVYGEMLL